MVRWCAAALFQRYCSAGSHKGGNESSGGGGGGGSSSTDVSDSACKASGSGAGGRDAAGAGAGGGVWPLVEAKALAEHFAAVSFGDPLFATAVATLLRRSVPLDTQV